MKKIAIIGAGPGGLSAGMVLVTKGYEVHVFEKDDRVGGRNQRMDVSGYQFDLGPTFLMYLEILEDVFNEAGENLRDHLELIQLDELYKLRFNDVTFNMNKDKEKNYLMYEEYQKGLGDAYVKWYQAQEKKLKLAAPILKKPFPNYTHFFRKDVLRMAPYVHPLQSVYKNLSKFSKNEAFIHSLSFQAKYLGMASYKAPSLFTILPFLEHDLGLYHIKGGLNQISEQMAKIIQAKGGHLHLNTPVEEILVKDKKAYGLKINNETHLFDEIIINADFAYAMDNLVSQDNLKKYKKEKLANKKYSVSTFMLYLGLDTLLDIHHHEIIFSKDYEAYLKGLMKDELTDDFSLYVHNPSKTDPSYAKDGHSSLYVLMPVPNVASKIDFENRKDELTQKAIKLLNQTYGIKIEDHIVAKKVITPNDWQKNHNVYLGAVFNLAHNLGQMLNRRPQNKFEEIDHVYLVGGGTHPGSGLPTIYQSALILKNYL